MVGEFVALQYSLSMGGHTWTGWITGMRGCDCGWLHLTWQKYPPRL